MIALLLASCFGDVEPQSKPPDDVARPAWVSSVQGRGLDLAVDARGRALAAWQTQDGQLVVASQGEGGWEETRPTRELQGRASWAQLAVGSEGQALLVWRQETEGIGRILASVRGGDGAWEAVDMERPLSNPAVNSYEPRPHFDRDGTQMVVWNGWTDTGYRVHLSEREADGEWRSIEEPLSIPRFHSNAPRVAQGPHGAVWVTWYQSLGGPLRVFASSRWPNQSWRRPTREDDALSLDVGPVEGNGKRGPEVAISPSGEVVVVWNQADGNGNVPVFHARRALDASWQKPVSGKDALGAHGAVARAPRVAFDGGGGLWVVWDQAEGEEPSGVYLAYRDPSGSWRAPIRISGERRGWSPAILGVQTGPVVVVWIEEGASGNRVQMRVGRDGTLGQAETLHEGDLGFGKPALAAHPDGQRVWIGWDGLEGVQVVERSLGRE